MYIESYKIVECALIWAHDAILSFLNAYLWSLQNKRCSCPKIQGDRMTNSGWWTMWEYATSAKLGFPATPIERKQDVLACS
jgi:hypothetical protein